HELEHAHPLRPTSDAEQDLVALLHVEAVRSLSWVVSVFGVDPVEHVPSVPGPDGRRGTEVYWTGPEGVRAARPRRRGGIDCRSQQSAGIRRHTPEHLASLRRLNDVRLDLIRRGLMEPGTFKFLAPK